MKEVKVFYLDETPYQPGKMMIRMHHDKFFCTSTTGSYNILPARLLGLSYAWYLRMCRDELGADIIGKGSLYPVPYFTNKILADQLVKLLNKCATQVLWEREHPDEWAMAGPVIRDERRRAKLEEKHRESLHHQGTA